MAANAGTGAGPRRGPARFGPAALSDPVDVLALDRENSIFRSQMIQNPPDHIPPRGPFRVSAMIGARQHRHAVEMKQSGVVDLARVDALGAGTTGGRNGRPLPCARPRRAQRMSGR